MKYVELSGVYSLPYQVVKAVVGNNNQMYYKITVREEIEVHVNRDTFFYRLNLKEIHKVDDNKNTHTNEQL